MYLLSFFSGILYNFCYHFNFDLYCCFSDTTLKHHLKKSSNYLFYFFVTLISLNNPLFYFINAILFFTCHLNEYGINCYNYDLMFMLLLLLMIILCNNFYSEIKSAKTVKTVKTNNICEFLTILLFCLVGYFFDIICFLDTKHSTIKLTFRCFYLFLMFLIVLINVLIFKIFAKDYNYVFCFLFGYIFILCINEIILLLKDFFGVFNLMFHKILTYIEPH